MNNSANRLENLLEEGYDFNFADCINQGFKIVNKNIGGFIGYALIYFAITGVLNLIPIIGGIVQLFTSPPLIVGFYIVAQKIRKEEHYEFGDFFKGFDFFRPLVGASLLAGLILLFTFVPMGIIIFLLGDMMENPVTDDLSGVAIGLISLFMFPIIYLITAYNWSSMLIIFHGYSALESMKMSRKLITKRWFLIFGYLILISLIGIAGVLLVGIGMLYTVPVFMCANYVVFHEVTKGEEIDDVIDHLVE